MGALLCVDYMLNTARIKEADETVVVPPEALGALLRSEAQNTSQTSATQKGKKICGNGTFFRQDCGCRLKTRSTE